MQKLFFGILLIFLLISPSTSQALVWEKIPPPPGGFVRSMSYLPKNDIIFVSGVRFAYLNLKSGKWVFPDSVPLPSMKQAWAAESSSGRIVFGNDENVFYTDDMFKTSSVINKPSMTGNTLARFMGDEIFYMSSNKLFISSDWGVSWKEVSIPVEGNFHSPWNFDVSPGGRIFAQIRDVKLKCWLSEDSGETWENIVPPSSDVPYTQISFRNDNEIFLKEHSIIYRSTDGGRTFKTLEDFQLSIYGFRFFGRNLESILVFSDRYRFIYKLELDGSDPMQVMIPDGLSPVTDLAIGSDNEIYLAKSTSGILSSNDTGRNWRVVGLPGHGEMCGTSFDKFGNLFVFPCAEKGPWPFFTSNGGRDWIQVSSLPYNTKKIIPQKNGNRHVAFADGLIFISIDGGSSWKKKNTIIDVNGKFNSASYLSDWILMASYSYSNGTSITYKSVDFGETWNIVENIGGDYGLYSMPDGKTFSLTSSAFAMSSDLGLSWELIDVSELVTSILSWEIGPGVNNPIYGWAPYYVYFNHYGELTLQVIRGYGVPIEGNRVQVSWFCYTSADNGNTWKLQFSMDKDTKTDYSRIEQYSWPYFDSRNLPYWIVNGNIYSSLDGGHSYYKLSVNEDYEILKNAASFNLSPTDNFIAQHWVGGTWVTRLEKLDFPVEPVELLLLPNPAADYISIAYNSIGTMETEIKIFDVQGNMVKTEKFDEVGPGTKLRQINIQALSIGAYYLRIISGGDLKVGMFIKAM